MVVQKHRALVVDLLIGLRLTIIHDPLCVSPLCSPALLARRPNRMRVLPAVVVQGHRLDPFEDVGCYQAIINTSLTNVPPRHAPASLHRNRPTPDLTVTLSTPGWNALLGPFLLTSSLSIRLIIMGLI